MSLYFKTNLLVVSLTISSWSKIIFSGSLHSPVIFLTKLFTDSAPNSYPGCDTVVSDGSVTAEKSMLSNPITAASCGIFIF